MVAINSCLSVDFQQNAHKQNQKTHKFMAYTACGAVLAPLLPLIDGDGLKEAYKNRNVAKYVTGMAAVGTLFTALNLILDKFNKENRSEKNTYKAMVGAITLPLALVVDNWAKVGEKRIDKKWYAVAAVAGVLFSATFTRLFDK